MGKDFFFILPPRIPASSSTLLKRNPWSLPEYYDILCREDKEKEKDTHSLDVVLSKTSHVLAVWHLLVSFYYHQPLFKLTLLSTIDCRLGRNNLHNNLQVQTFSRIVFTRDDHTALRIVRIFPYPSTPHQIPEKDGSCKQGKAQQQQKRFWGLWIQGLA